MIVPIPSVKDLASSDPTLRRNNLNTILSHLSERTERFPLDTTQCLQLWRGFSVALYMHDSKNMLSVQKLISTLASTLKTMYDNDLSYQHRNSLASFTPATPPRDNWPNLSTYTPAFWETISREWSNIDQWRMNKYLLLIRFFIRELLQIIFRHQLSYSGTDDKGLLDEQLAILNQWPFSPRERKVPDGLRLHVLDVWMEEIERANESVTVEAEVEEGSEGSQGSETGPGAESKEDGKDEEGSEDQQTKDDNKGVTHPNPESEVKTKVETLTTPKKRKRTSPDPDGDGDGDDNDDDREEVNQKKPATSNNIPPTKETLSIDQTITKLIEPIRALAKEALGKGVKMKAREIIREIDAANNEHSQKLE